MSFSVKRRAPLAFSPLALALAISSSSFAQSNPEESLEAVVVTASRTAQKAGDVLADHIVITREEILESGQTSLADLLQTKRSIEIKRNGGAGNDTEVYIRGGNGKQTVLLIDGVRSVSTTSGTPTWSAIPLSQIDRIEIVMGPLSSLYGADAVSGVIQVFTRKGSGAPQLHLSAGAGTYGERVYSVGVSGATEGEHRIRYSVMASQEEADGFSSRTAPPYDPDKDHYEKRSVSGQFSWQLAQDHELGLTLLNSRNDGQYDGGTGTPVFKPYIVNDVDVYSIYSRNQLTANWARLLQVSRSYNKQRQYTSVRPLINDTTLDQYTWQNDLAIGSDLLQMVLERREESVINSGQPLQNRSRSTNSAAVAYQLNRGNHLASASTRYDDSSVYGSTVTGGLGYGYKFTSAWRVNGSVTTSFRAPTYNDLYYSLASSPTYGNPDAKPEKGRNAEVGGYYDDGQANFSVVYYRNSLKDMLAAKPCDNGALGDCTYNIDRAVLAGLSIEAGRRIGDFRVFGTLDLQDPRDKATDTLIARRAKSHGVIGLTHRNGAIRSGADVIFSGHRFDNAGELNRMGGYTLLNLHASYDLNRDWQLFARWNNALDKKYELARTYQTPGSNVFVGIRYGYQ